MTKCFLSPHEIATLIVVDTAPDQIQHADADAISLLRAELVELLPAVSGRIRLTTTLKGRELLRRLGLFTNASSLTNASDSEAFEGY